MATPKHGARRGPEEFCFCISNLPKRYTWQDLKDLIRQQASHGLRTDMMGVLPNTPFGVGSARVQGREEADRLYNFLTTNSVENRRLIVHLWDTNRSPAALICSNDSGNPQPIPQQISEMALSPDWQYFMPTSPLAVPANSYQLSSLNGYGAPPNPMAPTTMPAMATPEIAPYTQDQMIMAMSKMSLNPMNPMDRQNFHRQYMQSRQARMGPQPVPYQTYTRNANGLPTNTSQGVVQTQARGIFVSGLDYKARTRDIENYFKKAGDIIKVDLQKDLATGKSKGNATIEYASAESVQRAIDMFHDKKFMSMRVKVRADRNPTAVAAPSASGSSQQRKFAGAPTIVNGSVQTIAGAAQARKDSVFSTEN